MISTFKEERIITLSEACRILGYSLGYGYQIYHTWKDYGVRFLKYRPNSRTKFFLSDILKMMEVCK